MGYSPPYPIIQQEGGNHSGRRRRRRRSRGPSNSGRRRIASGPMRRVNFKTKTGKVIAFNARSRPTGGRRYRPHGSGKKIISGRGFADEQLKSLAGEVGRTAITEAASLGLSGIKALRNKFRKRRIDTSKKKIETVLNNGRRGVLSLADLTPA